MRVNKPSAFVQQAIRLGGVAGVMAALALTQAMGASATVVTTFNPAIGELPEGLTVPSAGLQKDHILVSIVPRAVVMKIVGSLPVPFAWISDPTDRIGLGLASDAAGDIYWAVAAAGPGGTAPIGIYKVPQRGGTATLLSEPTIPVFQPNAIDVIGTDVYWTDAILGFINKTDARTGATTVWSADPLLAGQLGQCGGTPVPFPLGANGITHDRGTIYIANTDFGRIVALPIGDDGSAGMPTVIAESCELLHGADGLVADRNGSLLVTRQPTSSIVRVKRNGKVSVVYAGAPLDGPASDFLLVRNDSRRLLVTNSTLGSPPGGPGPSLVSLRLGDDK